MSWIEVQVDADDIIEQFNFKRDILSYFKDDIEEWAKENLKDEIKDDILEDLTSAEIKKLCLELTDGEIKQLAEEAGFTVTDGEE